MGVIAFAKPAPRKAIRYSAQAKVGGGGGGGGPKMREIDKIIDMNQLIVSNSW